MILSSISGDPIGIPVSSRVTYSAALYSTGFRSQESFLFMTLSLKLCVMFVLMLIAYIYSLIHSFLITLPLLYKIFRFR